MDNARKEKRRTIQLPNSHNYEDLCTMTSKTVVQIQIFSVAEHIAFIGPHVPELGYLRKASSGFCTQDASKRRNSNR